MQTFVRSALGALFAFSLVGCGGAQTPAAESPEPAAKAAKADDERAKTAKAEPKPADEPEEVDPRADGLRKASRPPGELITGPNLIYMFNFKESAVGKAA